MPLKVAIFPRRGSIPLKMAIGFLERMLSARLITLAVIDDRYDFSTDEGRYFGFGGCCCGFEMASLVLISRRVFWLLMALERSVWVLMGTGACNGIVFDILW